jgi:hypothetical protein
MERNYRLLYDENKALASMQLKHRGQIEALEKFNGCGEGAMIPDVPSNCRERPRSFKGLKGKAKRAIKKAQERHEFEVTIAHGQTLLTPIIIQRRAELVQWLRHKFRYVATFVYNNIITISLMYTLYTHPGTCVCR